MLNNETYLRTTSIRYFTGLIASHGDQRSYPVVVVSGPVHSDRIFVFLIQVYLNLALSTII
jgi:hypothetical protein